MKYRVEIKQTFERVQTFEVEADSEAEAVAAPHGGRLVSEGPLRWASDEVEAVEVIA